MQYNELHILLFGRYSLLNIPALLFNNCCQIINKWPKVRANANIDDQKYD